MQPELQNAIVLFLVAVIGAVGAYIGSWLQNRGQREKQATEFERQKAAIEAEQEAQNAKNQEVIRNTIAVYVNQLGRMETDLRALRERQSKLHEDLNAATLNLNAAKFELNGLRQTRERQEKELTIFRSNLESAEKTIKALGDKLLEKEGESKLRDKQLADLTKRLETLEHERNTLREQLDKSNGELAAREQTIKEQHAELEKLSGKVERMQEQLNALQKRDTAPLDPASVPDTDPAAGKPDAPES